jgi:hypothetical protein
MYPHHLTGGSLCCDPRRAVLSKSLPTYYEAYHDRSSEGDMECEKPSGPFRGLIVMSH